MLSTFKWEIKRISTFCIFCTEANQEEKIKDPHCLSLCGKSDYLQNTPRIETGLWPKCWTPVLCLFQACNPPSHLACLSSTIPYHTIPYHTSPYYHTILYSIPYNTIKYHNMPSVGHQFSVPTMQPTHLVGLSKPQKKTTPRIWLFSGPAQQSMRFTTTIVGWTYLKQMPALKRVWTHFI